MLLLGTSDKEGVETTTGKFGLGFKSVFLLCDEPRLQSGGLDCTLKGGLLPEATVSDEPSFRPEAHQERPATIFHLPVNPRLVEEPRELTEHPAHWGGLALVFAQHVSRLLCRTGDQVREYSWDVCPVPGADGVAVGHIHRLDGAGVDERVLVVSSKKEAPGPRLQAVFALSGGRFIRWPKELPTVWVTVPTNESWGLGYCVGGPFDLDVGRAQLARENEGNVELADRLGGALGKGLIALFDALGTDWTTVAPLLGLPYDPLRKADHWRQFWESAWDLMTLQRPTLVSGGERDALLERFQGYPEGGPRGISRLVEKREALPTGLPGAWSGLVAVSRVERVAHRELTQPGLAVKLQAIPEVAESIAERPMVAEGVAQSVESLRFKRANSRLVDAATLLAESLPRVCSSIDDLACIEPVLMVLRWLRDHQERDEGERVAAWLRTLRFPSSSGSTAPAADLIISPLTDEVREGIGTLGYRKRLHDLDDEFRRAGFAPLECQLDPAWCLSPQALCLFLEARVQLGVGGMKDVVSWIRGASSPEARAAAALYLLEGDWSEQALRELDKRSPRLPWLRSRFDVENSLDLAPLSHAQRATLAVRLFPPSAHQVFKLSDAVWAGSADDDEADDPGPVEPMVPEEDRREVLHRLWTWWDGEREGLIEDHECGCYPGFLSAAELATRLGEGDNGELDAEAWMVILILGAGRSLGRTQDAQHKSFIEFLREQDDGLGEASWWEVLLDPERPERWMAMLRRWQDDAVNKLTRQRWMNLFPVYYQLARFWKVYARIFLTSGRRKQFDFAMLCTPLQDDALRGAGVGWRAPPVPMNMGAHWVLRELVRMRVVQGRQLWEASFVPSLEVVRLLQRFGLQVEPRDRNDVKAKAIHDLLLEVLGEDRVDFHRSFDLPLWRLAHDGQLREKLGME